MERRSEVQRSRSRSSSTAERVFHGAAFTRLRKLLLMLLSLAAPVRRTIRVDGAERVFWAQTPSAAPPASGWPVVLSFHGWCMTATQQADDDGLRKLGASTAIVVHPEGYSDPTDCQQYDCGAWQSFNGGGSAAPKPQATDQSASPTTSPRTAGSATSRARRSRRTRELGAFTARRSRRCCRPRPSPRRRALPPSARSDSASRRCFASLEIGSPAARRSSEVVRSPTR